MSETIADEEIRDTNTYNFDNDSGAVQETQIFHVVNNLDAEVTVTFYGTRQEDADSFTDGEQLGSLTISAGATDYQTISEPWEEARMEVVASTSPTSGTLEIYEMN